MHVQVFCYGDIHATKAVHVANIAFHYPAAVCRRTNCIHQTKRGAQKKGKENCCDSGVQAAGNALRETKNCMRKRCCVSRDDAASHAVMHDRLSRHASCCSILCGVWSCCSETNLPSGFQWFEAGFLLSVLFGAFRVLQHPPSKNALYDAELVKYVPCVGLQSVTRCSQTCKKWHSINRNSWQALKSPPAAQNPATMKQLTAASHVG